MTYVQQCSQKRVKNERKLPIIDQYVLSYVLHLTRINQRAYTGVSAMQLQKELVSYYSCHLYLVV